MGSSTAVREKGIQRRSIGESVWVPRRRRHRGIMSVAEEASTSEATAGAVGDELASLQHLTQPGEKGEEEEEEDEGGEGGTELPLSSEEESTTKSPPATAVAAVAAESAAPQKQPRDGNTNAIIATIVSDEDNNAPIDWVLSRRLPENSRRFYRKALEAGGVKVDGRKTRRFVRVKSGARISVDLGPQDKQQADTAATAAAATTTSQQTPLVFPERLPRLRVVFEDEHLFAIM